MTIHEVTLHVPDDIYKEFVNVAESVAKEHKVKMSPTSFMEFTLHSQTKATLQTDFEEFLALRAVLSDE